jgi:VanZ family protein
MGNIFWSALWVFMTALIFYNSSLPAEASDEISCSVVGLVSWINAFLDKPVSLPVLNHIIRKASHFSEFFVQTLLLCKVFCSFRVSRKTSSGYILLLCLMTAVTDEFIQLHTSGRSGQISDIMLDFSGGFSGWLLYQEWGGNR